MFKVISETLVWWPVLFSGVAEDGAVVDNKIELRFRILDEDTIVEPAATATPSAMPQPPPRNEARPASLPFAPSADWAIRAMADASCPDCCANMTLRRDPLA